MDKNIGLWVSQNSRSPARSLDLGHDGSRIEWEARRRHKPWQ